MKRREFINWAGLGLIASYLPVALAACSENSAKADNSPTADQGEFLSLGTATQLDETGYLLDEKSEVLVIKDKDGQLSALNPTCTHQGCIVEWKKDANQLVCPCHNAKYAPDGKVLAKPAPEPLAIYEVKEENSEILVKTT